MSLGTTSISELPVANQQGPPVNLALQESNSNESINNSAQKLTQQREMDDNKVAQQNQPPPNPQDFMKRVETDVEAVKQTGQLKLPERDIPRENTHITQDAAVKPNFVPEAPDDYIKKYQTNEVVQEVRAKKEKREKQYDFLYDELQGPIIISLLYFLFQLPVVNKTLIKNIPKLFKNDGNLNTQGYLFSSILFGSCYFLFTKAVDHIAA